MYDGEEEWTWMEDDIWVAYRGFCPLQWKKEELPEKCYYYLERLMLDAEQTGL